MAQRAESLGVQKTHTRLAPVVSLPVGRVPDNRNVVGMIIYRAQAAYRSAQSRVVHTYSVVAWKSDVMMMTVRRRIQKARNEKPLQLVALAAGTAFALGVALRVWRSRNE
jgi:hypothetical protein